MNRLQDRVALVTGGTRGIGRAIVQELVAEGATVVFTYAGSQAKAEALSAELGGKATGVQADVADFTQAQAVVDEVVKTHGRLDVLVNNAGITRDGLLLRMTEQDWDDVVNTNLKGAFNYTKAVAKTLLKQRGGSIVNIGSVVGEGGNPGQANYAASKSGLLAFTKSVAKELGSRGIRANVVAPGFIVTEMTADLPEAEREKWAANIPMGRGGEPQEVAKLVVFLASDEASYITGQAIRIDGGMG